MPAIGERRYRVLRLGDRHAVAGGDDDLAGVCEELGDSLGVDGGDLALVLRRPACARGRGVRAEAAEDDRGEGPVHRLAHDPGQVGARGAHEGPGDDEQRVAQHEAGGRRRPPGVRVEHGDDDGHVASADRGDEVEPERERDDRHEQERDPRQRGALLDAQEDDHEEGADDERPEVEPVATRQREGSALDRAESLRQAMIEPVSVTPPMKTPRKISPRWKAPSARACALGRLMPGQTGERHDEQERRDEVRQARPT